MSEDFLIERDEYLSAGAHIGLVFKNKDMEKFIYKVRPNGLAVLNLSMLDKRICLTAKMLAKAEFPLVVGRKNAALKAIEKFSETTGIKAITGRFMPGSLTNPSFENFFEPDLILLTDPSSDSQAKKEAIKMRIPIISLCDTFNSTSFVDLVVPCNNKGGKALGLIYWLLAREVAKEKDIEFNAKLEEFVTEEKED